MHVWNPLSLYRFNKKYKKRSHLVISIFSLATIVAVLFGSVLTKLIDYYFFRDAQNSFENKKFAEAYGGSCNFEELSNGQSVFSDMSVFYPQWSSGYSVVTAQEATTTTIPLPFDFKFSGRTVNDIGINASTIESNSTASENSTRLYPGFSALGTNDLMSFDTRGVGMPTVPDNVKIQVNGGNGSGDYYVRRRDGIKTKSFQVQGKNVFGMKVEYYTPANAPYASSATNVVAYTNTSTNINPTDFLSDVNDDAITLTSTFSQPAHGTVTLDQANNRFVYTPNTDFYGSDQFVFTAKSLANGDQVSSNVSINVLSNYAYADSYSASSGSQVIPVLSNDYFQPGQSTVSIVSGPSVTTSSSPWGTATVNSNNEIVFDVPTSGFGEMQYAITDTITGQVTTTTLSVSSQGTVPPSLVNQNYYGSQISNAQAFSDYIYIPIGGQVTVHPLQNDYVFEPNSTIQITDTGSFTTPLSAYSINSDGSVTIDTTKLTNANEVPRYSVRSPSGLLSPETELHLHAVTKNDFSDNYYFVDGTYNVIKYTTQDDYGQVDATTLNYTISTPSVLGYNTSYSDSKSGDSAGGLVTPGGTISNLNYTLNQLNCQPQAQDDTFTVPSNTATNLNVIGNILTSPYYNNNGSNNGSDYDYEFTRSATGSPLNVVSIITPPSHGTYVINSDNTIAYTPTTGYIGTDSFVYQLRDTSTVNSTDNSYTSTAQANITIQSQPLNAVDDPYTINKNTVSTFDVLSNDTPGSFGPLQIDSLTQPAHGNVVITNNKAVYTPTTDFVSTDTFTYTAKDANGNTDTATVTVTVNNTNQDPNAVDDPFTLNQDTTGTIDVLHNDTDPDTGDILSICGITNPAHGSATIVNGKIQYIPASNYSGSDTFTYVACDNHGGQDTAKVTITVNQVLPPVMTPNPPTEVALQVSIKKNKPDTLLINDKLKLQVETTNPNTTAVANATTTVTFDSTVFSYLTNSATEGPFAQLLLGEIKAYAQNGITFTANGNTITASYPSIAAGQTKVFNFEVSGNRLGSSDFTAVARFDSLSATSKVQAQVAQLNVVLPRTGGMTLMIMLATGITVGIIIGNIRSERKKIEKVG